MKKKQTNLIIYLTRGLIALCVGVEKFFKKN